MRTQKLNAASTTSDVKQSFIAAQRSLSVKEIPTQSSTPSTLNVNKDLKQSFSESGISKEIGQRPKTSVPKSA
jgi:hypothetical protein